MVSGSSLMMSNHAMNARKVPTDRMAKVLRRGLRRSAWNQATAKSTTDIPKMYGLAAESGAKTAIQLPPSPAIIKLIGNTQHDAAAKSATSEPPRLARETVSAIEQTSP